MIGGYYNGNFVFDSIKVEKGEMEVVMMVVAGIITYYDGTCTTIEATVPYTDKCGCQKNGSEDKQVNDNCKLTIS